MSRSYKTIGVIVRSIKIGEADAILSVISQEYGLMRLKAKGVRKIKSKLSGYLQTPNFVKLEIARGRGSLDIICSAETTETYPKIKNNLAKTAFVFFILENYLVLVGEAREEKAFQILVRTLEFLNNLKDFNSLDKVVCIWFIVHLLECSGQSMELYQCSTCKTKLSGKILFSPESGGTICKSCAKDVTIAFDIPKNGVKLLRILAHMPLSEIKKLKATDAVLEKTYLVISSYSEYFIDYRLNSRDFFDDIRKRA